MKIINKTTFVEYFGNANNYSELIYAKYTGKYPECLPKYMKWNLDNTIILEMTEQEKTIVDDGLLEIVKDKKISEIKTDSELYETMIFSKKQQRRASMDVYDTIKKATVKKRMAGADGEEKDKISLVNEATTIEQVEAIKFDL